jgi:uncharacterized repeat protein (TIGR04076 family)
MTRIKISVVKGFTVEEVFQGEPPAHLPEDFTSPCPVHLEGQEFILDNSLGCPAGFCSWAYADIQKDLVDLYFGSDYYSEKRVNWVTCTDGLRPVVFRIERVED